MIDAIVFDKDGTLYEFHTTFADWAVTILDEFSDGDADLRKRMAEAIRFDLEARAFFNDSVVIAGTNREVAELIHAVAPQASVAAWEQRLIITSAQAPLAEAVDLQSLLGVLQGRGLGLGVMTNDGESAARSQLGRSGISERFDVILGADSGHGGKPDAAPLLAACRLLGVEPSRAAMVGDSTHDLIAAQRAGMRAVAVCTGMATGDELAGYADVVLPDIGHLPGWLDSL